VNDLLVLDTSAIFAFLEGEPGTTTVRGYIDTAGRGEAHILLCFVTLAELRYVIMQEQNEAAADHAVALVKSWPVEWVHSAEQLCLAAAWLKARHRVSLADAFIAATAQLHGAALVHKDPEFEALSEHIRLLPLPYKKQLP
jgi:predicted nucleic acid-binding protein